MEPLDSLGASGGLTLLSGLLHLVMKPAIDGRLQRNPLVGIRTRATMSSDTAWLAGHRAAGPWMRVMVRAGYVAGLGSIGLALALAALGRQSPMPLVIAIAGYAAVLVLLALAAKQANTAARRTP